MNNFRIENRSIISDYFYFTKETIIKCNNCQIARFKFQTFYYLDFHIDEVLKYKIFVFKNYNKRQTINIENNINNDNLMINNVNILDCFLYERNMKSQKIYWNNCQGSYQFLIIILKLHLLLKL